MVPLRATGETLTLRYATPDDAPALFELARDPDVTRFFSWGPYERVEQALAYIEGLEGKRERGELLDFVIVHADAGPIGVTGLGEHSARDRRAVVGSWLGRRWWGSGANTEAKALVCRIAFESLGLLRVGAYASPRNPRSVAALTKLGWVLEGTLRSFHVHGDVVHDVHVLSLLRDDFAASPLAAVPGRLEGEPPPAYAPS